MIRKQKTPAQPIQRVVGLLEDVRQTGLGYTALCPAHDDNSASLSVKEGEDGRVLVKCFAGCEPEQVVAALGLEMADLFPKSRAKVSQDSLTTTGLTLGAYAEGKRLRADFLRDLQVGQIYVDGMPVVRIPYLDRNGVVISTRMRVSLDGESKFRWKTGSKPTLYGLWRLAERNSKYVCLVEGESDAQTLWLKKFSALGLPGAATWREAWAENLAQFERIYVVIEPDKGGDAVQRWLQNSSIRDRVRLIKLDGAKDPSELYLSDPEGFAEAWKRAMKTAVPWTELENAEAKASRKEAWKKCKVLAGERDILSLFIEDLRRRNLVGETRSAKLLYLVVTSRLLDRPVSAAVVATSSAGKSFVVERTLEYFPPDAFYALTAMSERALAYSTEPLKNRFIVLYEGAALESDFQNYILRSLLSEGRLRYETVEKTPEGLQSRLIEREGPTGLILTTTNVKLNPENATRYLTIPVSDSTVQTQRVLLALARATNDEGDTNGDSTSLEVWRALQEWLTFARRRVVIPYATALASLVPPVAVRLRRDFTAILNLIKAHAILHQATRERDESGRIIATIADYRAVWDLVKDLISEGVDQTVSKTIRATVRKVAEICDENGAGDARLRPISIRQREFIDAVTVVELARALRIDRSSASRRTKQCLIRGYLRNVETKRGQPIRLIVGDSLPGTNSLMPTPEELKLEWKGKNN
jgi:hypothetical protein